MVEIVFHQAAFFKRIIDSLKGLVEDISFVCNSDSMDLQAMDVSHVSLISISLPAESFSSYTCNDTINLSFNVETLTKILKSSGSNDILRIVTDKPKDDIEMQISSPNDDKTTRFRLKPVDLDDEKVGIPEHIYKAKLTFGSSSFNQLVRSLSEVNDTMIVRCTEGSVSFSVSDSLVDATTTFNSGITHDNLEDEVSIEVTETCKVSYALRYLKAISSASALTNRVSLSFSPHFPLLVEYNLTEGGYVRFYLAPKVEEDDEGSDEI